jgi:hypothetical protein
LTISTSASSVTLSGNGATTVFDYSFVAGSASYISVIYTDASGNETTLLPSQYTLVINAPAAGQVWGVGGSVTYPTVGSPIASGTTLTIVRTVPEEQLVSISNQGDFYPAAVEQALDLLEMQIQQVSVAPARSIQAPLVDLNPQMTLPAAAQRAGQFVSFDSNGNVIVAGSSGGGVPISAAMQPVVEAATLALGRTALGVAIGTNVEAWSQLLDDIAGITWEQGDLLYFNGTHLVALVPGTAGQLFETQGASANPRWNPNATLINGLQLGSPTGGDKGAGTLNAASGVYLNGEGPIKAIAQIVNSETGAVSTGTTTLPNDDTIPQNTEGDQYLSLSITPVNSGSTLYIDVFLELASSATGVLTVALFQDSTANALAAMQQDYVTSAAQTNFAFRHKMTAGTTSATTLKVRAGNTSAGTTTFNGVGGSRLMGGVMASSITITEVLP